ncbi:MAG: HEAT repeat domain-containing protein [Candidatus Hydrogenedentes bacterium]|nr:HEAT repeat domain-containing protein [Candidatus Hydrogenedentota bacterium]
MLRVVPAEEPEYPGEWHVIRFVPGRVLKGTIAQQEIQVRYLAPLPGAGSGFCVFPNLPDKGRALLFLDEPDVGDPAYTLPQDCACWMPLAPAPTALGEDAGLDVISAIQSEALASLRYRGVGEAGLWVATVRALRMYSIPNTDIVRELRALSVSEDPSLRVRMLAARVRFKDYGALEDMVVTLEAFEPSPAVTWHVVAGALDSVESAECLPSLKAVLDSPTLDDAYRLLAAYSVAHRIDDDRAVPLLVELLSDRDPRVQLHAIHGLYRLEKTDRTVDLPGPDYAPGVELFEANPDKYLNNWRAWWATTGRLKYAHVLNGN